MTKKIIASAVLAAALLASASVSAASAAPVHVVSAAKVTVTAAQKKAVKMAIADATAAGDTTILVTGYKKASAASKALVAYATSAATAAGLTVRAVAGNAEDGLEVVAADDTTDGSFFINGVNLRDGGSLTVAAGTTSVVADANFVSPYVTFSVDGTTGLTDGDNIVSITATAANGDQNIYNFDIFVTPASN